MSRFATLARLAKRFVIPKFASLHGSDRGDAFPVMTGGLAEGLRFSVEWPGNTGVDPVPVNSPENLSGWLIPPSSQELRSIEIWAAGTLVAKARRGIPRPDVQQAFPDCADAFWSGFDVEVPLDRWVGQTVEFALVARWHDGAHILAQTRLAVQQKIGERPRRKRDFDLRPLLACPLCQRTGLREQQHELACSRCRGSFEVRRGTPHFTSPSDPSTSRLLESTSTNPYSAEAEAIIRQHANGVVLDFGAGNTDPERWSPNVLYHEALHYPQIDVVCLLPRLPYRDDVFDAVISQAVFEHLARPWETASELHRVLKPGGRIHVDTAFMQPFHADPCHFFNMTLSGLREVFHQFRELKVGVKPYQTAAWGLRMQWDVMLQHLRPGPWRDRITQLRMLIDREDFDGELDHLGQKYLAAGVFFDGIKDA